MGASRYWRLSGFQTPNNTLSLTALKLSDGTTDYPTATLTADLSQGFRINWDLGSAISIDTVKLTAASESGYPTEFLLEESADNVAWTVYGYGYGSFGKVIFPGSGVEQVVKRSDDFYLNAVSLLLYGNGADGSTTVSDSSFTSKTVTPFGNARIKTDQSKFGGSSMYFDGAGDYLQLANSADFAFGSGDFTVEAWVYRAAGGPLYKSVLGFANGGATNANYAYQFIITNTGQLWPSVFQGSSQYGALGTAGLVVADQWSHIAVVRAGNDLLSFVNGVLDETTDITGVTLNNPAGAVLQVGQVQGVYPFAGYIDDFRITKGVARYTGNFTPPTAEFPDVSSASGYTTRVVLGTPSVTQAVVVRDPGYSSDPKVGPVPSQSNVVDMVDGGLFRIVGTVAEKALPTNTPLRRKVKLIRDLDGRCIRETWSDAVTGEYAFSDVIGDCTYSVVSYDYTNTYRAVIADNLTPEPMP